MFSEFEKCPYCGHKLYKLGDGMSKCSDCKRKTSPKRYATIISLIDAFCEGETALSASKRCRLTYPTVLKYYQIFRLLSAQYCEDRYRQNREKNLLEYEEHLYLEKSKRYKADTLFDSRNILTFVLGEEVYTLLMPSLKRFRTPLIHEDLKKVSSKEFSRFLRNSKLTNVAHKENVLNRFWDFFESFIIAFKGVDETFFPYYLKEAEFKFNTPLSQRAEILKDYYFSTH